MRKTYLNDVPHKDSLPTQEALDQINVHTRKPLTAEEVYVFPVKLCDNEIDRDYERLSLSALEALAALYVGKTGIFNHDLRAENQSARIYATELCTDQTRVTSCGETYTYLRAMAYIPRIPKYASLIREIDSGMHKEVSIHCSAGSAVCSVCGADMRKNPCAHVRGQVYDGQICHHILSGVRDVYEWSFVAVPAQREAGVTKSYQTTEDLPMQDILKSVREAQSSLTLDAAQLRALRRQLDTLECDADAGKAYKAHLTAEAVRYGTAAMPQLPAACLERICGALNADDLQMLCQSLRDAAEKKLPLMPQLAGEPAQTDTNNAFLI